MLSKITWSEYWLFIATTTTLYYAVIVTGYFRRELFSLFSRKGKMNLMPDKLQTEGYNDHAANTSTPQSFKANEGDNSTSSNNDNDEGTDELASQNTEGESTGGDGSEADEETLQRLEILSDAINGAMEAHGGVTNKEELIVTLAATIKKNSSAIDLEPFAESIEWHIKRQSLYICGIELSEADIRRIWTIARDPA